MVSETSSADGIYSDACRGVRMLITRRWEVHTEMDVRYQYLHTVPLGKRRNREGGRCFTCVVCVVIMRGWLGGGGGVVMVW